MWIQKILGQGQKPVLALLAVSLMITAFQPVKALDTALLIRSVPLEVSAYAEAANLDEQVKDADSTLTLISSTGPLIVHMEGLRRAYSHYADNQQEKDKLMKGLKDRYMADTNNAEKFFDYGYAQLVMEGNKNGLFFLRKANDKLASPFTSLAYGLAQVDIDRAIENASAEELTTRKMDAMYKLKDALAFNKEDLLPGVWPSYLHILEGLKPYPAYDTLKNEDVTTIYVPFGTVSMTRNPASGSQSLALTDTGAGMSRESHNGTPVAMTSTATTDRVSTCSFNSAPPNWSTLAQSKALDMLNDGRSISINFFSTQANSPYDVRVMGPDNKTLGQFTSYKAPYIAEDLEGDGKYELVIRQFDKDPYHPLFVYRWNGSCFVEDQRVTSFFK